MDLIPTITSISNKILVSGSYITVTNTTTSQDIYATWNFYDGDNDTLQYEMSKLTAIFK